MLEGKVTLIEFHGLQCPVWTLGPAKIGGGSAGSATKTTISAFKQAPERTLAPADDQDAVMLPVPSR